MNHDCTYDKSHVHMYSTAFDICYKYEFVVVSTHGLITSFNLNVDASKIVFILLLNEHQSKEKFPLLLLSLLLSLTLSLLRFTCHLRRSRDTPFYLEESEPALNSQSTKTRFCQRENIVLSKIWVKFSPLKQNIFGQKSLSTMQNMLFF